VTESPLDHAIRVYSDACVRAHRLGVEVSAAALAELTAILPAPWKPDGWGGKFGSDYAWIIVHRYPNSQWGAAAYGPRLPEDVVVGVAQDTPRLALRDLARRLRRGQKPWKVRALVLTDNVLLGRAVGCPQ
jgi:hypothetical protein